jgi:hypothetical protein
MIVASEAEFDQGDVVTAVRTTQHSLGSDTLLGHGEPDGQALGLPLA